MNWKLTNLFVWWLVSFAISTSVIAEPLIIDFETWSLDSESAWIGPVDEEGALHRPGFFGGTERVGAFAIDEAEFVNRYNLSFDSWSGFGISNQTDQLTPGAANQTSAFVVSEREDLGGQFAVAFGYVDELDPTSHEQLHELPHVQIPDHTFPLLMHVANTTYAALSMRDGDQFAERFGGEDGTAPDFFRLTVYGVDEAEQLLPHVAEVYLADFRFEDHTSDYIADEWIPVDLTQLAAARKLYFNLDSSDSNASGMVTPAYFALDNLVLQAEVFGDLDFDGVVTAADAQQLCSGIANLESRFDYTRDGLVDVLDLQYFQQETQMLPADANFDGSVGFDDFLILSNHFGATGGWQQADFTCDGMVAFDDFLLLSSSFGATRGSAVAKNVPEPSFGIAGVFAWLVVRLRGKTCWR